MPGPVVAINGEWYDLGKFSKHHPGGNRCHFYIYKMFTLVGNSMALTEMLMCLSPVVQCVPVFVGVKILEHFDGEDATDAFVALHSDRAAKQLKNMRPIESKQPIPEANKLDRSFREFREKLQADGWWDREPLTEFMLLVPILAAIVWGTLYSYTHPVSAMFVIGIAMTQAGWLGHDMNHARNSSYCSALSPYVAGVINGFDPVWWSRKHNTHHVFTNHVGIDPDIDMMPVLFLMAPSKALDSHLRKWQHFYALFAYSTLYYVWRMQSFMFAWEHGDKRSLMIMLPGYLWLLCLPALVSFGSILVGGFFVGFVVVQSHEAEELQDIDDGKKTFIEAQFAGTCDVECPDPISEYMFGGMQYQLTHHLFPTMPRYKYPRAQKVIMDWARKNNVEYKKMGMVDMAIKHFAHLRKNALAECDESCRPNGWSAAQMH